MLSHEVGLSRLELLINDNLLQQHDGLVELLLAGVGVGVCVVQGLLSMLISKSSSAPRVSSSIMFGKCDLYFKCNSAHYIMVSNPIINKSYHGHARGQPHQGQAIPW